MNELERDLRAARAVIAYPDHWGRFDLHRDGRYCMLGAMWSAAGVDLGDPWTMSPSFETHERWLRMIDCVAAEPEVRENVKFCSTSKAVSIWNDCSAGHSEVLAVIDRCIERLASERRQATIDELKPRDGKEPDEPIVVSLNVDAKYMPVVLSALRDMGVQTN
jgi:hypothetical protein